jgi:hypothetical protein
MRPQKPEARQMRVCRASTGGRTGGQGPTRAIQFYLVLVYLVWVYLVWVY